MLHVKTCDRREEKQRTSSPFASGGTGSPAHRPRASTSTSAWSATSGTKRGTAPQQEGGLRHTPRKDHSSKKGISNPFGEKALFPNKTTPIANAQDTQLIHALMYYAFRPQPLLFMIPQLSILKTRNHHLCYQLH